jgi:hypothetical protein
VDYKKLSTKIMSMDFFDRLEESGGWASHGGSYSATRSGLIITTPLPDITAGGEGYIRKCLDEDFHGVLVSRNAPTGALEMARLKADPKLHCSLRKVSDKLREMLVNEDSENCNVFGEEEQRELIFQIFKLLAIGGGMCQCEDTVNPYLDATKTLYKVSRG